MLTEFSKFNFLENFGKRNLSFENGLCISGNPNKGNSVIRCYQQTRPNGTLVVSSYSTYIRRLVTRPLFRSRARVALGSELRLLMSFSWPVFPGLDPDLFLPWFSSFFGIRLQNGASSGHLFQMLSWPGSFLSMFSWFLGIRFQSGAKECIV